MSDTTSEPPAHFTEAQGSDAPEHLPAPAASPVYQPEPSPEPSHEPMMNLPQAPRSNAGQNMPRSLPRVPPHSEDAEQSVLGSMLLDNRVWDDVADKVSEGDFYRKSHRVVFRMMAKLMEQSQPVDVLTLTERLKLAGELDLAGGEAYLFSLAKNTPTAANVTAYADIVRERSILRKLVETGTDIVNQAFNTEGRASNELLDAAEQLVFKISSENDRGSGPESLSTLLTRTTERIDEMYRSTEAVKGLATGFVDFDEMTAGLQPGDLVIVAGRPSMGKTVFGVNIAEHAAIKCDKPALIFSMEMPAESIVMRLLSSLGRVNQHRVRTGDLNDDDWPRITSAVSMLSEAKMYIDDTPAMTPTEIRSRARRVARENGGLSVIVVDYLQLMTVAGMSENRTQEVSEISRSLKALAKELNVPVVALSQLNRGLESRTDKRPVMADLRESGAIEQDADLIAFIYRDEVYNEDSPDKGTAEILIRKQRNGPIGMVRLTFLGEFTRFENYTPTMAPVEGF